MRLEQRLPFSVLCVVLALVLLGIAGCGGGGDDSNSPAANETGEATTESGNTESGEDSSATTNESGDDSGSGNAPAPSGDAVRAEKVEIDNFSYKPDPVKIEEGGKVIWQNEDSVAHTA